jgi:hypothetical protein
MLSIAVIEADILFFAAFGKRLQRITETKRPICFEVDAAKEPYTTEQCFKIGLVLN